MPSLTIKNLEPITKQRLKIQAASHGCSMEEEARRILREALAEPKNEKGLASEIHRRFSDVGGIELDLPARSIPRSAPDFKDSPE